MSSGERKRRHGRTREGERGRGKKEQMEGGSEGARREGGRREGREEENKRVWSLFTRQMTGEKSRNTHGSAVISRELHSQNFDQVLVRGRLAA